MLTSHKCLFFQLGICQPTTRHHVLFLAAASGVCFFLFFSHTFTETSQSFAMNPTFSLISEYFTVMIGKVSQEKHWCSDFFPGPQRVMLGTVFLL